MDPVKADPRRGLPSASAMLRLSLCPGSHALIEALKARGLFYEPYDPDREAGNRFHAWLADITRGSPDKRELAEDELGTAQKAVELRQELVLAWAGGALSSVQTEIIVERRFWYPSRWNGRFSGQLDFAIMDFGTRRALVINYKSGRKDAQPAADNLQLRAEVVLLKAAFPVLESIEGAVVEPWVRWDPVRVKYAGAALQEAAGEILAIADRALWDIEHRFAGDHCFHCPARAHCQEARNYIANLYQLAVKQGRGLVELPLGARGSEIIENIKTVREMLSAMEAEYKRVLADKPDALAHHYLHDGRALRSVTNIKAARERLAQVIDADEFEACLDASVAKLEKAFAKKKGLKLKLKQKVGEKAFADYMGALVQIEHAEPYIWKR